MAPDFPPAAPSSAPPPGAVDFLLRLGSALHGSGYPSPSLETALTRLANRFGLASQFFSTPTSLFSSFGPLEEQRTYLQRVEPGEVNLERLADLHEVIRAVENGEQSPVAASQRVDAVLAAPSPYGPTLTTLAFGMASAGAALLLGGGFAEAVSAGLVGLAIGLLALLARHLTGLQAIFEPLAALLASFLAAAIAHFGGGSVFVATLAGLIVLLPGFTLTVALTELATRHLASGTARLAGAAVVFLTIGFGVAAGNKLAATVFGPPSLVFSTLPTNWVTEVLAFVLAPLAFVVLLRAPARDAGWIALTGFAAVEGGRLGAIALGPEMGTFVGALTVGALSQVFSRITRRPPVVTLVPGILLLVPGSIGFRSLSQLMEREVVLGVETLFRMAFVAISLVAGLLVVNTIVPHRRGSVL